MTRVLVLGGSGFLGRHLLTSLHEKREIVATVRSSHGKRVLDQYSVDQVACDVSNTNQILNVLTANEPAVLVSCVSLGTGLANPIVQASEQYGGLRRAIFVSTTSIFTNLNPPSKPVRVAAEAQIAQSELPWIVCRPTMIYGSPGDRNLERLLRLLAKTRLAPVPTTQALQQPINVRDLAKLLETLATDLSSSEDGTAINAPGPSAVSFEALVNTAASALDLRHHSIKFPIRPAALAIDALNRIGLHAPISAEQIRRLQEDKSFDPGPAKKILGSMTPLIEGLRHEARQLGLRE